MSGARRARGHRPRGVRAGSGFAGELFTFTAPLGAMARAPVNTCERSQARAPPATCTLSSGERVTHGRRRSTSGRAGALLYTYPNTRSRVARDEFLERDETESSAKREADRKRTRIMINRHASVNTKIRKRGWRFRVYSTKFYNWPGCSSNPAYVDAPPPARVASPRASCDASPPPQRTNPRCAARWPGRA